MAKVWNWGVKILDGRVLSIDVILQVAVIYSIPLFNAVGYSLNEF